jgi:hypothetical protein
VLCITLVNIFTLVYCFRVCVGSCDFGLKMSGQSVINFWTVEFYVFLWLTLLTESNVLELVQEAN